MPTTPGGIVYSHLTKGYREQWAKDANQLVSVAQVAWQDGASFRDEVCGSTTWNGASPELNRHVPFLCPLTNKLYCETCELVGFGASPSLTSFSDPLNDGWLQQSTAQYQMMFRRQPYEVMTDDEMHAAGKTEKDRYVSAVRSYQARERRVPSHGFEQIITGNPPVSEVGFILDYVVEFLITWHQIPVEAVPDRKIADRIATVNNADFVIPLLGKSLTAAAETLLFKGPTDSLKPYPGADQRLYHDLTYRFSWRPSTYGWNGYRRPDGTYVRLRHRGVSPDKYPYEQTDFPSLFTPGDT